MKGKHLELIEEEKNTSDWTIHKAVNPHFETRYLTNAEVYKNYTRMTYDISRAKKKVEGFLSCTETLEKLNVLKSIGYDGNKVETFLLF